MRIALVVGGIALVVVAGYLIWFTPSDIDRLQSAFEGATSCPNSTQETLPDDELAGYMNGVARYDGEQFAAYITRTEPELTLISCPGAGPTVRYFAFATDREARGVIARHHGDLCLDSNVVVELKRSAVYAYCDDVGGEIKSPQ